MNRTIKFRCWDKENKKMRQVSYMSLDGINGQFCICENQDELDGVEVMQFTGLFDKQGREIYEGDIVKARNDKSDWTAEISYVNDSFCLVNRNCCNICESGRGTICDLGEVLRGIEIIGNVFENPDLIKSEVK